MRTSGSRPALRVRGRSTRCSVAHSRCPCSDRIVARRSAASRFTVTTAADDPVTRIVTPPRMSNDVASLTGLRFPIAPRAARQRASRVPACSADEASTSAVASLSSSRRTTTSSSRGLARAPRAGARRFFDALGERRGQHAVAVLVRPVARGVLVRPDLDVVMASPTTSSPVLRPAARQPGYPVHWPPPGLRWSPLMARHSQSHLSSAHPPPPLPAIVLPTGSRPATGDHVRKDFDEPNDSPGRATSRLPDPFRPDGATPRPHARCSTTNIASVFTRAITARPGIGSPRRR